MIDLQPSEAQQLIVETLRNFASKEIRPCARDCDESGALPDPVLHAAHELGLVANALEEQQDNAGGRKCLVPWLDGGDTLLVTATTDEGPRAFPAPRYTAPPHGLGAIERDVIEMEAELQAARLLNWRAASMMNRGAPDNPPSSMQREEKPCP